MASRTCAEVSDALALVAAVLLDPDAQTSASAPGTADVEAPPSIPPPALPQESPARATPAPPARAREVGARWIVAGGAAVGVLGGIGPALAPAGGVFGDVERRGPGGVVSSLRLAVDVAATSSDVRSGTQTYEWLGATVRLCPAYLSIPAGLRFAPGLGLQVGGHRGTTRDVQDPTTSLQLWVAPLASGVLEWELSSAVSLELSAGILFPLRRTRFFLAPDSTIFAVPAAAGTTGVGVRVRFL